MGSTENIDTITKNNYSVSKLVKICMELCLRRQHIKIFQKGKEAESYTNLLMALQVSSQN